jgi:hypothetical protein
MDLVVDVVMKVSSLFFFVGSLEFDRLHFSSSCSFRSHFVRYTLRPSFTVPLPFPLSLTSLFTFSISLSLSLLQQFSGDGGLLFPFTFMIHMRLMS